MSSGKNTQEYQKVKKSFPKLTAAIAGVIGPISGELLAAGLITNGQKDKAGNSVKDAGDRASDLVSLILNKVEQDSQNFNVFVNILKEDLDTFQTVLNHMSVSTESGPSTAPKNGATPGPAAATPTPKAFSDALSPTELVAWLFQQFQAKGLTLESSLGQKLIDDDINGEAFMDLEDKDLADMGFKKGQRMKILKIIQSVKDGNDESISDQNQTPPKPTQEENKAEATKTPVLSILTLTKLRGKGKEVEIIKAVTPDWKGFGLHLNFDPVGRDLDTIDKRNKDPADCCQDMFKHWLNGNGVDATWDNVIEILDAVGLKNVAKDVRAIIY